MSAFWNWLKSIFPAPKIQVKLPDEIETIQVPTAVPAPQAAEDRADLGPALAFTLKNEGGYTDVLADRGGATNFGITIGDLSEYLGRQATKAEVKAMVLDTAKAIYKKKYWDKLNLDNCAYQNVATCIFDMGVLCGTRTSAKWAQSCVGVSEDGVLGKESFNAINTTNPASFISRFADKAQEYFNMIVDHNHSQAVFLKGWTNRVNRLRDLSHAVAAPAPQTPAKETLSVRKQNFLTVANSLGYEKQAHEVLDFWAKAYPNSDPKNYAMFDVGLSDTRRRFFVIDGDNASVQPHSAAHGKGSDLNNDNIADKFSDVSGSEETSLGIYRCSEIFHGSHPGLSMRLDGLQSTNAHARAREVIVHQATYVTEDGNAGRSWGCPALDPKVADTVINQLHDGSPLYIFKA